MRIVKMIAVNEHQLGENVTVKKSQNNVKPQFNDSCWFQIIVVDIELLI